LTAQRLDRVVTCYRIGDPSGAFPIFDDTGSTLYPGRWNTASSPMVYTSEHYSTALLEKLAHSSGILPPNQHYIEITIPNGIGYEVLNEPDLPGWDNLPPTVSQRHGEQWQQDGRSLLLFVPSILARIERNILINRRHPEASQVQWSLHQPVWWDARLFRASP
jgi:RES domain-containing protein